MLHTENPAEISPGEKSAANTLADEAAAKPTTPEAKSVVNDMADEATTDEATADEATADEAVAKPTVDETATGEPAADSSAAEAEDDERLRRSRNRFQFGFLLYVALFLIVGAVALLVFWNFLGDYEMSLPETAMSRYIDALPESYWEAAIREKIAGTVSAYESEDEITKKALRAVRSGERQYVRKTNEGSDESPVYRVLIGGKELLTLHLETAGELSFGFHAWHVAGCSMNPDKLPTGTLRTFQWTVPTGAVLSINGRSVDDSSVFAASVPASELSVLEPQSPLRMTVYRAALYAKPDITVTLDGAPLSGDAAGYYAYPGVSWLTGLTVTAPSIAAVYVNGVALPDEYCTETVRYEATAFEDEPAETYRRYALPALSDSPTVTATADGRTYTLKRLGNNYALAYPDDLYYTITLYVPAGASVTVNGKPLPTSYRTREKVPLETLIPFKKFLSPLPSADVYVIGGLYALPEITVTQNGTALTVTAEPASEDAPRDRVYNAAPIPTEAQHNLAATLSERFFKTYMTYIENGYKHLDANYDAAIALVIYKSDAYALIKKTKVGIQFNSPVTPSFKQLGIENLAVYSDKCFGCDIVFDLDELSGKTVLRELSGYMHLVFIETDGEWLVASFSLSQNQT